MTGVTATVVLLFGSMAISPIGALMAASFDRQFYHVVVMLYWMCGFATAAHATLVFGP
jgi:hypothetical protein